MLDEAKFPGPDPYPDPPMVPVRSYSTTQEAFDLQRAELPLSKSVRPIRRQSQSFRVALTFCPARREGGRRQRRTATPSVAGSKRARHVGS